MTATCATGPGTRTVNAESLWQASTVRAALDDGPVPRTADVVIVGGGLLGVCCAYWLARAGHRPVVVERDDIASGATGRNGGLVIPTTAEPYPDVVRRHGPHVARAVRRLVVEGASLLEEILAEEDTPRTYRTAGLVLMALNGSEATDLTEEVAQSQAHGFAATWLDRSSLARHVGTPLGERILGGMHLSGALTNPVGLVDGLASAARRHGARVHTGVKVTDVRGTGGGARVQTTAGEIHAAAAVVAVNAWLGELVPRLREVVRPVQGQLIATTPMPSMFPFGMAARLTPGGEYWQQAPDGTIVLGGCRLVADAPPDPTAQRPQPEVHAALLRVLPELFPGIGPIRARMGWAGVMAFTPDGLPVTDQVDDGIWAVGGFNGHGMPCGAIVGRLLAESAITGARSSALAPFRLDRSTLATAGQREH